MELYPSTTAAAARPPADSGGLDEAAVWLAGGTAAGEPFRQVLDGLVAPGPGANPTDGAPGALPGPVASPGTLLGESPGTGVSTEIGSAASGPPLADLLATLDLSSPGSVPGPSSPAAQGSNHPAGAQAGTPGQQGVASLAATSAPGGPATQLTQTASGPPLEAAAAAHATSTSSATPAGAATADASVALQGVAAAPIIEPGGAGADAGDGIMPSAGTPDRAGVGGAASSNAGPPTRTPIGTVESVPGESATQGATRAAGASPLLPRDLAAPLGPGGGDEAPVPAGRTPAGSATPASPAGEPTIGTNRDSGFAAEAVDRGSTLAGGHTRALEASIPPARLGVSAEESGHWARAGDSRESAAAPPSSWHRGGGEAKGTTIDPAPRSGPPAGPAVPARGGHVAGPSPEAAGGEAPAVPRSIPLSDAKPAMAPPTAPAAPPIAERTLVVGALPQATHQAGAEPTEGPGVELDKPISVDRPLGAAASEPRNSTHREVATLGEQGAGEDQPGRRSPLPTPPSPGRPRGSGIALGSTGLSPGGMLAPAGASAFVAALSGASAGAPPETLDLPQQIVRAMHVVWRDGLGEAQVRLQPSFLGEVTVSLHLANGHVSATLQAESEVVRNWMRTHESELRAALAAQGLTLDRLVVEEHAQPRERRPSREPRPARPRPGRDPDAGFELHV